jgi:hypothetical protein
MGHPSIPFDAAMTQMGWWLFRPSPKRVPLNCRSLHFGRRDDKGEGGASIEI